jgi:hypothetical protein
MEGGPSGGSTGATLRPHGGGAERGSRARRRDSWARGSRVARGAAAGHWGLGRPGWGGSETGEGNPNFRAYIQTYL